MLGLLTAFAVPRGFSSFLAVPVGLHVGAGDSMCIGLSLACQKRGGLLSEFHVLAALAEDFSNIYSCYF